MLSTKALRHAVIWTAATTHLSHNPCAAPHPIANDDAPHASDPITSEHDREVSQL
jgi:hypothetical protein